MSSTEVLIGSDAFFFFSFFYAGHICLDILYDTRNGGWSPALTINKVALSLRSMLASATEARKPPGDADYCTRSRGKSPKDTRWDFEDDKV